MKTYMITAFEKSGNKVLDESFTAADNDEAKVIGADLLEEKGFAELAYRCVTSNGKLVLFHR